MDAAFDLSDSKGAQLDVTGDIVGRERVLSFDPEDGSSPVLEDETYRLLQRAKISTNMWDGTIPGALALWENLFPEHRLVIRDNQDMTMDLYIIGRISPLEQELISKNYITPKPMGVLIRFNFIITAAYSVRDYHAGAAMEIVRDFFSEDIEMDIVTHAADYYAGAISERIKEVHVE
jgi:hypothetical protein